MKLYPNPSSCQLTVETSTGGRARIESMLGEVLWEGELKAGKNRLELGSLAKGMYILYLPQNQNAQKIKIIRQLIRYGNKSEGSVCYPKVHDGKVVLSGFS